MNTSRRLPVAGLLFCSGLCALIYQTVWLREFRLIFGASTAASAAVLGIFMGGLGLGSALLGRRVEATRRPLGLYANLEVLIAVTAALTPLLVWLVRHVYVASGGTAVLGQGWGTVIRLLLSAAVLIVPTFLMGGTLPAAARAVETEDDLGRRNLALLYGGNTLGAVTGAALSTFVLLEAFGNRNTLWLACGLNLLVAIVARAMSRSLGDTPAAPVAVASAAAPNSVTSPRFIIFAAAAVGFAFMLMELVWYRMLAPLLGGSTFTFGLILIVALLGIGLGGAAYALLGANRQPTLKAFALTCGLESLAIAIPFALGDRIASLTLMLRPLSALGFGGQVFGWTIITMLLVLPAAIIAGYQFPMLIALLGRGREDVGRHTGLAYAANTGGAIVGSLAGGFGLLPLLTAPGAWKAVILLLAALALVTAVVSILRREQWPVGAMVGSAGALACLMALGPTAAWRHSGIGAGRADKTTPSTNGLQDFAQFFRRTIIWEAEGVESSVAMASDHGLSFVINGKIDGNSRQDAGTQVMGGLLGAFLHPAPKRACVIGLGTGSTAGWLGAVPAIERVDAIEFEPAVLEVVRACAAVNHDVLSNPKVRTIIGDAREVLLTTPEAYDIIFSEPSNPYRAGIASLFTREFYHAITERLAPGGIFLQWLQAYDVDGEAVRTAYATLGSVFPHVETWRTKANDLILVATHAPMRLDATELRTRIATEPFRSALRDVWRVEDLEGVLSHFVASDGVTRAAVSLGEPICTDDKNSLEFGFARMVGRRKDVSVIDQVLAFAAAQKLDRPAGLRGEVSWESVNAQMPTLEALDGAGAAPLPGESLLRGAHRHALQLAVMGEHATLAALLRQKAIEPLNLLELEVIANVWASVGADEAPAWIERWKAVRSGDAEALRGRWHLRRKEWPQAAAAFTAAFTSWRTDPWAMPQTVVQALEDAAELGRTCGQPAIARQLFDALEQPFAVSLGLEQRRASRVELAKYTEENRVNPQLRIALDDYGPNGVWQENFLRLRLRTYALLSDARMEQAALDCARFSAHEPVRFEKGLTAPAAAATEAAPAVNSGAPVVAVSRAEQ